MGPYIRAGGRVQAKLSLLIRIPIATFLVAFIGTRTVLIHIGEVLLSAQPFLVPHLLGRFVGRSPLDAILTDVDSSIFLKAIVLITLLFAQLPPPTRTSIRERVRPTIRVVSGPLMSIFFLLHTQLLRAATLIGTVATLAHRIPQGQQVDIPRLVAILIRPLVPYCSLLKAKGTPILFVVAIFR